MRISAHWFAAFLANSPDYQRHRGVDEELQQCWVRRQPGRVNEFVYCPMCLGFDTLPV
jgi:hypothetical protein